MMKIQRLSNQQPTFRGTNARKLRSAATRRPWDYNGDLVRCLLGYLGEGAIVRNPWHLLPARTVCLSIWLGLLCFQHSSLGETRNKVERCTHRLQRKHGSCEAQVPDSLANITIVFSLFAFLFWCRWACRECSMASARPPTIVCSTVSPLCYLSMYFV